MHKSLVGTGFVGAALAGQWTFDAIYNSRNISDIAGKSYDLLVCAAAPATMWAANQNPDADKANIKALFAALQQVSVGHFVLISTIAVLNDTAAGYTEESARYEIEKAYGRHRRELELALSEHFRTTHILRLPALFGAGLKKNFLFDLANPAPSFIRPEIWDRTRAALASDDAALLDYYYALDTKLNMWALDRAQLNADSARADVDELFTRLGMAARNFTNSASRFQYFNMARLGATIDTAIAHKLAVLNVCSEPLEAAHIARELTGEGFVSPGVVLVHEDMRSGHAALFGGSGNYLFPAASVLNDIRAFYAAQQA